MPTPTITVYEQEVITTRDDGDALSNVREKILETGSRQGASAVRLGVRATQIGEARKARTNSQDRFGAGTLAGQPATLVPKAPTEWTERLFGVTSGSGCRGPKGERYSNRTWQHSPCAGWKDARSAGVDQPAGIGKGITLWPRVGCRHARSCRIRLK